MHWYWKVRIYRPGGNYSHGQIITDRNLEQINTIQDFYKTLTGCKMLLEGMSESPYELLPIDAAFRPLWGCVE